MPTRTLNIKKTTPLHARIARELESRIKLADDGRSPQEKKWTRAEELVQAYVPEKADDALRRTAREEDGTPAYTTISVPYTYAMLMAAHTYWTNVFFARSPIHQYQGRHGEPEMQIQALESLISYQVHIGKMLAPYYLWLYDAGKYGLGVLGSYWDVDTRYYSDIDANGEYVTMSRVGYVGNRAYNVSPFEFFPDPRVPVKLFQKGEFCGVLRHLAWNELKLKEAKGYYTNLEFVKTGATYRSNRQEGHLDRPRPPSDLGWETSKHPAHVDVFEIYVELIPSEWKLGSNKMPEKWVFTVTADFETLIGAMPFNAIHCEYPFDVLEPEVEAYGQWTRGLPAIMESIENVINWLINSHFFNVRAIADGRFVADPSRIELSGLEGEAPGFVLKVKPGAMGQDVRTMFQQLQLTDPTAAHFGDIGQLLGIGERVFGISDQVLGALSAGGRRTAAESRISAGFSTSRLKTTSEYMGAQGYIDHAQRLVQTSQQFYQGEMVLRLVGDLARFGSDRLVNVTPDSIAGAYDFIPVDGNLPIDRFAQATLWKDIFTQIVRIPQIAAQYDLGGIFSWVASLAGLKNINQFRIQVGSPEALQQQAEAGNIVPITGGGPPAGSSRSTNRMVPPEAS